jgi:hypothetical protein
MILEAVTILMEKMRFAGGELRRDQTSKHDFRSVSIEIDDFVIEVSVRVNKPPVRR